MEFVVGLLLTLLLLAVIVSGLWLLALRGNPSNSDFYGLAKFRFAHRGLYHPERNIPENSLRAFRTAVKNGYGAELDVHLSQDERLVVMHDENLQRMTGLDKDICDVTAETLDALNLETTGEKIPYLEEVLPIFDGKAPLIIEIKTKDKNYAQLTKKVCSLLERYEDLPFCIESFDPRVLIWLRKNEPSILRGQLSQNFMKDRSGLKLPMAFVLTNLLTNILAQPDFIAYRYKDRNCLPLRLCKRVWHTQEVSWTIRRQKEANEALKRNALVIFEGFAAE